MILPLIATLVLSKELPLGLVKLGVTENSLLYREDASGYATVVGDQVQCYDVNGKVQRKHSTPVNAIPTHFNARGILETLPYANQYHWVSTNQTLVGASKGVKSLNGNLALESTIDRFGGIGFSPSGKVAAVISQAPVYPLLTSYQTDHRGEFNKVGLSIPVIAEVGMVAPAEGLNDLVLLDEENVLFFGFARGPYNEQKMRDSLAAALDLTATTVGKNWEPRDNVTNVGFLVVTSIRTGYSQIVAKFNINSPLERVSRYGSVVPDKDRKYVFFTCNDSVYRVTTSDVLARLH